MYPFCKAARAEEVQVALWQVPKPRTGMLKPELRGRVDVFVSSMVEQRIREYLHYRNVLYMVVFLECRED